jgi:DNA repair exonuclease SbcCD nuclease subunit
MRYVAFSDIHYADYSTGVTVADVVRVERAITTYCMQAKIGWCVFCGDRYLSHEPQDYVRVVSDQEQKYRNDHGIVTFSLVGNHDLYAKAPVSGHSNRHLQTVWGEFLPNIVVMDELKTYRHPSVPDVAVHAIPACFEWHDGMMAKFDFRPGEFNLLVFHDMLKGSVIDHTTEYRAPKGQRIELIDDARFQLVLGGDVHLPQRLAFQNTKGGYVGAAIQQSRRDRGNARGFLDVEDTATTFVESPSPRFVDATWDFDEAGAKLPTAQDIESRIDASYGDTAEGNIVDIVLMGSREQLESVLLDWHRKLQTELQARRVNAPMRRAKTNLPVVHRAASTAQRSPLEDLQAFLGSGRAALDGNDPERLLAKAAPILARIGGGK